MVHGLAIFISAFLLFQVQLIIGKLLLPWFGGAPSVWTTCMLFFQALLLAGYAYAHWLNCRPTLRRQVQVHGALLLVSLATLALSVWKWGSPILPGKAAGLDAHANPVTSIFLVLLAAVGLPFFVLSTTSPLLQRWYLVAGGTTPYRLYAVSNAGSMVGLLAYPFAVEPLLALTAQSWIWGMAYAIFVLLCAVIMKRILRAPESATAAAMAARLPSRTDPGNIVIWIMLSAVTSAMLLSVTNNLCQDIAVVPFLWVLPLAIYLLTFILCFESTRWYRRRWFVLAAALSTVVVLVTSFLGIQLKVLPHAVSYGLFLFLFCIVCHGELVRLKPEPGRLTAFYLAISAGGAIGALFVALGAPIWFSGLWEFHVTLLAGWMALAVVFIRDRQSFFFRGDRAHLILLVFLATYAGLKLMFQLGLARKPIAQYDVWIALGSAVAITALLFLLLWKFNRGHSKMWPRIMVGAILFLAECFLLSRVRSTHRTTIDVARNFYGALRITRVNIPGRPPLATHQLAHGFISHGFQFLDPVLSRQPCSYYSTNSGCGLAMRLHPRRVSGEDFHFGVLGLGAGTIASYARENETVRFYEINPAVIQFATGPEARFTYLKNCRGQATVIQGDARLALERELANRQTNGFDILVMDAFSGDSVPVHLLTVEAFETYWSHMRDENGIIAVNISNRFLDFANLMAALAKRFEMQMVIVESRGDPPDRTPSRWCLFTRSRGFVSLAEVRRVAQPQNPKAVAVWTDQFSNLFQLLKY